MEILLKLKFGNLLEALKIGMIVNQKLVIHFLKRILMKGAQKWRNLRFQDKKRKERKEEIHLKQYLMLLKEKLREEILFKHKILLEIVLYLIIVRKKIKN